MVEVTQDELASLRAENERLREVEERFLYLCRWVERGLFCEHTTPESALNNIAHHPGMPWKEGCWEVDHKPYAEQFFRTFPKARAALEQTDERR